MNYRETWSRGIREAVLEHLAPLGYVGQELDGASYVAESECLRILFELEHGGFLTSLQPKMFPDGRQVAIAAAMAVYAPEVYFFSKLVRNAAELGLEIDRQIGVLAQYCKPLLLCDMGRWQEIEKADALAKAPPPNDETTEGFVQRMRRIAEVAHQYGDHTRVYLAYTHIRARGVTLTPDEERKLQEAKNYWEVM